MLRKHFNLMKVEELGNLPLYSWQCLTLQLGNRDVDLVIKDEKEMDRFLKFLIHNLRTLDGNRGSANKLLDVMNKQSEEHHKTQAKTRKISETVRANLDLTNEHTVFRKVHLKYLIMRLRAKISFIALKKRMTI